MKHKLMQVRADRGTLLRSWRGAHLRPRFGFHLKEERKSRMPVQMEYIPIGFA